MPLEYSWCSAVLSGAPLVMRKQESWLEASVDNDGTGMALRLHLGRILTWLPGAQDGCRDQILVR